MGDAQLVANALEDTFLRNGIKRVVVAVRRGKAPRAQQLRIASKRAGIPVTRTQNVKHRVTGRNGIRDGLEGAEQRGLVIGTANIHNLGEFGRRHDLDVLRD